MWITNREYLSEDRESLKKDAVQDGGPWWTMQLLTNRNPEVGRNKSNLLHKLVESSSLQCTTPVRSYLLQSSSQCTFLICHIFLSAGVKGNVQGNLFKIITKNDIHYYIQASSKAERTQWIEAIKPLTWVRWTQWQRKSHTCDLVSCSLCLALFFFFFTLAFYFCYLYFHNT